MSQFEVKVEVLDVSYHWVCSLYKSLSVLGVHTSQYNVVLVPCIRFKARREAPFYTGNGSFLLGRDRCSQLLLSPCWWLHLRYTTTKMSTNSPSAQWSKEFRAIFIRDAMASSTKQGPLQMVSLFSLYGPVEVRGMTLVLFGRGHSFKSPANVQYPYLVYYAAHGDPPYPSWPQKGYEGAVLTPTNKLSTPVWVD